MVVLYEGQQIYFGPTGEARDFFTNMGFECPSRQTTADFLTSLTSATERRVKPGFEDKVPRTPAEFAQRWHNSPECARLLQEIDSFDKEHPIGGQSLATFSEARRLMQSTQQSVTPTMFVGYLLLTLSRRPKSPYTLSVLEQMNLCVKRGFLRLKADMSLTYTALFGNFFISLILGSVFYNLPADTTSFFSREALLFYAVLLAAFASALEVCHEAIRYLYSSCMDINTMTIDLDTLCPETHCGKAISICLLSSVCRGTGFHAVRSPLQIR